MIYLWICLCTIITLSKYGSAARKDNYFSMTGAGGNMKIGKYRYGEGRWAGRLLKVTKVKNVCFPKNKHVLVARAMDEDTFLIPPEYCFHTAITKEYQEPCNPKSPNKDQTNSSFSQVHDALFLVTRFQEIMADVFNDSTLTDCCGQIKVCVNYPATLSFYFTPESGHCHLYLGKEGTDYHDNVSPSMVGHLLGHALRGCTSKLLHTKVQSAAILESFADFTGILLKASLNNYETDWKHGNEIIKDKGLQSAIRYLNDPPLDGSSIDHTKHFNHTSQLASGIYSKAIYNLVTMKNWDLKKVYQLFLRSAKLYWVEDTGFQSGLCGLIYAAVDFGYSHQDVQDAFSKVGVFCDCPEGWKQREWTVGPGNNLTSCFKVMIGKNSWTDANAQCKAMDAQLVVVDNPEKSDWIQEILPGGNKSPKQFWLEASDLKSEGLWTWIDKGTLFNFTGWFPEEPNNSKKAQHCLALVNKDNVWGWTDEDCNSKKSFICELV